MACVPCAANALEIGPRDYLNQFIRLISTLRGGESRFLQLLVDKVSDTLPAMNTYVPRMPREPPDEYQEAYSSSPSSMALSTIEGPQMSSSLPSSPALSRLPDFPGARHRRSSSTPAIPQLMIAAPVPRSIPRIPMDGYYG